MTVPPVVSAAWLMTHLAEVQVVDGSWHLPVQGRDAVAEYTAERIPGAVHLDIDTVAAKVPGPPGRMLPPPYVFAAEVGKLGLQPDAHLVVYDSVGMYSAARVWWLFRTYGHDRISVMEGGLPAWKRASGEIESGPAAKLAPVAWPTTTAFNAVRSWQQVLANIDSAAEQLVDVRPATSFNGSTAAQYPGVRDGHIPGARNLSQRDLLNADATFKPAAELEAIIAAHGIAIDRPIVATCGSGVTACILSLALAITGREPCPIYDGSWEEWGMRRDLPAVVD